MFIIKKILLVSSLCLFLIHFSSLAHAPSYRVELPVHNIDSGLDYSTIQEAIGASQTLENHTIRVDPGVYYEHAIINKAIKLVGANRSLTRIDGNGTGYVISVKTHGAQISSFTIQNGERGVNLDHVQNATVYNNVIANCSYRGVFVWGCSNCKVLNNTLNSNREANIELWKSQGTSIADNIVEFSSHGIYLLINSIQNRIQGNILSGNPQGIVLSYYCENNTIIANTVTGSSVGGIVMGGAHNNTIYHNNLLNNTKRAWSYGKSSNFWDNGHEGNFWEGYPGPDTDGDGIGEVPFTIDEENRDNHPLMGTFSDFDVVWQEEKHPVDVISNSTISDFEFTAIHEPEVRKAINFKVTGEDGDLAFCRVKIPTTLMDYPYTVLVNGERVDVRILNISSSTHAYLHFTYSTSTKQVLIIPEFASHLFPSLLMVSITLAALFSRHGRFKRNPKQYDPR